MAVNKKGNKLTQANILIEKHDCMTTNEYRIFFSMLSAVNDKEKTIFFEIKSENPDLDEDKIRELTIKELCSLNNLRINLRVKDLINEWDLPPLKAYEYIKKAACSYRERGMLIEQVKGGKRQFVTLPLVSKISYESGSAYLDIYINELIIPYIAALSREYTIFKIDYIKKLPSANSIRLYEILKKNQSMIKYTVPVHELEELMFTNYKSRNLFMKKVVDKNIELINQNTDILVSYTLTGRGQSAVIDFTILAKKEYILSDGEQGDIEKEKLLIEAAEKVGDEEKNEYVDYIISKICTRIQTGEIKNPQQYIRSIISNDSMLQDFRDNRDAQLKEEKKIESELLKKYLEKIHKDAAEDLKKRKDLVYMMVPQAKSLEEEINELTRLLPKAIFSDAIEFEGNKINSKEVKELIEKKTDEMKDILDRNGFKPEILDQRYKCNICSDSCVDPDTGGHCSCRSERIREAKELSKDFTIGDKKIC